MAFDTHGHGLMVRLAGDLDVATAERVRTGVEEALERFRCQSLCLDLSAVDFIDSSGLGVILGRYRRINQAGGQMSLVCPSARVRSILELAGIPKLMPVYTSAAEAQRGG